MLKDINIVLDIDSTLVQSFEDLEELYKIIEEGTDEELEHLQEKTYGFRIEDVEEDGTTKPFFMWGITRPHLKEFILYCINNCKNVYVWSAGCPKYVNSIVDHIFKPLEYTPPIIFDGSETFINEESNIVNKPLERIFKKSGGEANERNTIIIDDRSDTFSMNEENGLLIPGFVLDDGESGKSGTIQLIQKFIANDDCLAKIIKFLENNKDVSDVRKLDFKGIFGEQEKKRKPVSISPSYFKK